MTAQGAEYIYIKGVKNLLFTNTLEKYWNEYNPRPNFIIQNSALYRGYVATWKIINNYLYLIDIVYYSDLGQCGLNNLFPYGGDKIKADWFTGELKIPKGERLKYIHMGYASKYERFLYLEFMDGLLVKKRLEVTDRSQSDFDPFKLL
jgi:hypothetical protein